jgi:hypothetical protein
MLYRIVCVLFLFLAVSCSHPEISATKEEAEYSFLDYKSLYAPATLPLQISANTLDTIPDSIQLSKILKERFIPDTIVGGNYGRKVFPVAEARVHDFQLVWVKTQQAQVSSGWMLVYDKQDSLLACHQVALGGQKAPRTFTLDTRNTFRISQQIKISGGSYTREDVYALKEDGSLFLVLTNSNEPLDGSMYNPIDTLARKQAYSGDYGDGKKNLISIRDGLQEMEFRFLIYLSKDQGACLVELDGIGRITGKNTGQYRDKQTDCILNFTFQKGSIKLEEENCGAYRGITCSFNGTYTRSKK